MSIHIVSKTGLLGSLKPLLVKINGENAGEIKAEQSAQVDLPSQAASIRVSRWGARSNALEVQEGDTVEITHTLWPSVVRMGMVILIILLYFESDPWHYPLVMAVLAGAALASLFWEEYRIEKKETPA